VIEPMGAEVFLYLNTGKHSFIARVGGHDKPAVNQEMELVLDISQVHFFDPDTEKVIV
ncbi:MAG: TOBE domain-containing protein, partial [Candidatus Omnitrophica bacterium]|nr:TOBE domain-containing protein [Candidatus Omnitrophota bacterium]